MSSYDEHLISQAGGDGDVAERLASIRKSNNTWLQSSVSDRNDRNTKFLLDLVEEQQARIERGNDALFDVLHKWRAGSHVSYSDIEDIRTALNATEPTP